MVVKEYGWDNVHDKIKVGDKFAFYVREMGSIASYKATVSKTFSAKDAKNTKKTGYWLHNFKFGVAGIVWHIILTFPVFAENGRAGIY